MGHVLLMGQSSPPFIGSSEWSKEVYKRRVNSWTQNVTVCWWVWITLKEESEHTFPTLFGQERFFHLCPFRLLEDVCLLAEKRGNCKARHIMGWTQGNPGSWGGANKELAGWGLHTGSCWTPDPRKKNEVTSSHASFCTFNNNKLVLCRTLCSGICWVHYFI